ncbi:MAG: hypothetical protein ABW168_03245 [Sedimenticola sp.]
MRKNKDTHHLESTYNMVEIGRYFGVHYMMVRRAVKKAEESGVCWNVRTDPCRFSIKDDGGSVFLAVLVMGVLVRVQQSTLIEGYAFNVSFFVTIQWYLFIGYSLLGSESIAHMDVGKKCELEAEALRQDGW